MGNGTDDAKRLILARRARFVAAALAGVAAACGGSTEESTPRPCLEPILRDASTDDAAVPQPCLEPLPPDASIDADADADAQPQPCLGALPPDAGDGGDGG